MTAHPIESVLVDSAAVAKSDMRGYEESRVRVRMASVSEVRSTDLSLTFGFDLGGFNYDKDTADTTTADDGSSCIIDSSGKRFKRKGIASINWRGEYDAAVTYQISDGVTFNNSSYVSTTADNVGSTPAIGSAHWQTLAQAGSPGGPISIPYTFSTTTTDADPGDGALRLNNATQNTATAIRADVLDNLGSSWGGVLDTFDDSTSTIKGFIRLQHEFDETKWLLFTISAVGSETGYRNITVANVGYSAASPLTNGDPVLLEFIRNGDKGDTGPNGFAGTISGTPSAGDAAFFTSATDVQGKSPSDARTALGLVIGTNVQAFDAQLSSNVPQNSKSAAYTLVLTDGEKHILHPSADTTARIFTIPANSSVAFPVGTAVTFVNQNGAGVVTIAITTDTLRLAGNGTTGSRTLAANGIATALKITSTEWIISGTGLT